VGHQLLIALTGARPGEKLHEELAYQAEELSPTRVDGVMAWDGPRPDRGEVMRMVAELSEMRQSHDAESVIRALCRYVPTLGKENQLRAPFGVIAEAHPQLSGIKAPDQNANATAA
jgi:FlaA1/EpsC-like NDP-sugar epimerase